MIAPDETTSLTSLPYHSNFRRRRSYNGMNAREKRDLLSRRLVNWYSQKLIDRQIQYLFTHFKILVYLRLLSSAAVGWDKTENKRVCPASWLVVLLGRLRMNDRITSPLLLAMPWNVWRHQSPSSASSLLSARFCFSHYFSHGDRPDRAQRRRFQSGLLFRNKSFLKLNLQFITVDVMQEYNNF